MSSGFDLKTYLMNKYDNPKYKDVSLLDLYTLDDKYYVMLEKENKVEPSAKDFFCVKGLDVIAASKISSKGFKRLNPFYFTSNWQMPL